MPKGNWLHRAAIGGLLIALTLSGSNAQNNKGDSTQTSEPEKAQSQPNPPLPITVHGSVRVEREKEVEPNWDSLKCDQAKSHDEADLCEQRRVANAAEQTVRLNWIQIGVAVVGFGLVLWNLYYVREGTRAAILAAEAAGRDHRPRMRLREFHLLELGGPHGATQVRFTLANVGSSKAIIRGVVAKSEFLATDKVLPPVTYVGEKSLETMNVFEPGAIQESISMAIGHSPTTVDEHKKSNLGLYVYGYVAYADSLNRTFLTAFCRLYDTVSRRFSKVEDPDYEYED